MGTTLNKKSILAWLYKKSLYDFIKGFWSSVESDNFSDSWLIEYEAECFMFSVKHFLPYYVWCDWISDEVYNYIKEKSGGECPVRDKMVNGKHCRNHNWNIAPRHMKSLIMNVFGPCWLASNTPISVASVSHSRDLSTEQNVKRQKLFESDLYKYFYSNEAGKSLKSSSASYLQLSSGAKLYSVAMTSFTGFGADVIIADDLVDVTKVAKDGAILRDAWDFFRKSMPTRLNTQETGVIWHIQQRIGNGDISGKIQEEKDLVNIYSNTVIKAISDRDNTIIFPCSGKVKHLQKGEPLWEERFGDYSSVKMQLGEDDFEIQYNQNVSKSSLNIVKDEYIKYITNEEFERFKKDYETRYFSYDCPVKDKEQNDFLGFTSGYGNTNELIIDASFAKHMGYVATKEYLYNIAEANPGCVQLLEDKANGSALIQDCSDIPGITGFDPGRRDKSQRLKLASVYMQNGSVRFVKNKDTEKLIDNIKKFPFLLHDDDVDSFSQLVIYHFTANKFGVYSGSFTYDNIINLKQEEYFTREYSATMDGEIIKVVSINRQMKDDCYIVCEEWSFNNTSSFEKWYSENCVNGTYILDCSSNNALSLITNNLKVPFIKFNDKDADKSISIIKQGFYNKKIKVYVGCSNTIRDIKKLRVKESNYNGETSNIRLETNEGFSKCIRGFITYFRGLSNIWY